MTDTAEMRLAKLIDKRFREIEDRVTAVEQAIKPEEPPHDPFEGLARHRKSRRRAGASAVQSE